MQTKTPIKVIKREERNRLENSTETAANPKRSAQEAARDMVATVSNWVNEFQQKRRTETKQAIKSLFPEPPQPSRV
ncbi:MAG: hypothetical protein JO360_10180 [Acidobacteria bacterium]|nr:hypothetical protein [Acidobacteriota bacterium]